MSPLDAEGQIKEITWLAKVIRADGTIEDLGVIASTNEDGPGSVNVLTRTKNFLNTLRSN